jgi:hypothetical protein
MESFTTTSQEDYRPEVIPGLEIVPTREEKPAPVISDIEGGLNIINSIIEKEGDENTSEKPPTLH